MRKLLVATSVCLAAAACGADAEPQGASDTDASSAADMFSCDLADKTSAPQDLHAAAADVLTLASPCGLSICHDGDRPEAGLALLGVSDLRAALVDKPACQAPGLLLVDGRGGDAALVNSWFWQKLVAPVESSGALLSTSAFGESKSCGQEPGQPYGTRMPKGSVTVAESRLAPIRNWICAGAPAP